jgi:BASS family bile acid:Na+ symporter
VRSALAQSANVAVIVFAVSSMLSVGLAYRTGRIVAPLRDVRGVFRALVANFVLVPLLAVGIERVIPMEPPVALALFLLAGSAGAPFLIKLASAARRDLALSAGLLVLLVPATVVFLPFYVPLAMRHPTLSGLSYVPSSRFALGLPLLSTLILPIVLGLIVRALAPRRAARLVPLSGRLATVALAVSVATIFLANPHELIGIVKTGAIAAGLLLIAGAFAAGYLLSRRERSAVLGLGTAQRNVAGAMVVASRDFGDPDILVMVTATVLAGLLVLFPIAWLLSRRAPHLGPPIPEARTRRGRRPVRETPAARDRAPHRDRAPRPAEPR